MTAATPQSRCRGCGAVDYVVDDDYCRGSPEGQSVAHCWDVVCQDCLDATGGICRAHQEPECTCYEVTGGHMPGCDFNHAR